MHLPAPCTGHWALDASCEQGTVSESAKPHGPVHMHSVHGWLGSMEVRQVYVSTKVQVHRAAFTVSPVATWLMAVLCVLGERFSLLLCSLRRPWCLPGCRSHGLLLTAGPTAFPPLGSLHVRPPCRCSHAACLPLCSS